MAWSGFGRVWRVGGPATGNAQRHELLEILLIALCATLSGAENCVDMALFGEAKTPLFRRFMRLPGGIPSHDTFSRLFRLLDPEAFEACFGRFVAAFAARVEDVVAIDGKTARRSFDRRAGATPLHLVSAWASEQRLVLAQRQVDGDSNEIKALPALLALLALDGQIVTADAMHCQKATAQVILDRGGDHVLARKTNQPTLLDDAACCSTIRPHQKMTSPRPPTATMAELRHAWPRSSMMSPGGPRRMAGRGSRPSARSLPSARSTAKTTTATRYYLLSRPLSATRFAEIARAIARQSKWKRHDNQEEDLGIAARACLSWRDDIASPFLIVVARRSRACFDGRT